MSSSYEYYKIFYYVAESSSFTKAAYILNSNQPNITRTINQLEYDLGCKLFIRSHRGVALTPEGERFYEHVKIAISHLQLGEQQLKSTLELKEGVVNIGVSETAMHLYVLDKLEEFRMKYPNIRLHITTHSTPQALKAVEERMIDFAVITTPARLSDHLEQVELMGFREILVGGKAYEDLAKKRHYLKELEKESFIMLEKDTMSRHFYNEILSEQGVELNPNVEAQAMEQVLSMARKNIGIGFVPEQAAKEKIETEELFRIPIYEKIPERKVILVREKERYLSVGAKAFVEMIR